MTFYAPPDQIDQVNYAKDVGVRMLNYMEEYFGIDYPLPKAGKFFTINIHPCLKLVRFLTFKFSYLSQWRPCKEVDVDFNRNSWTFDLLEINL